MTVIRLLVCGSRTYADATRLERVLDGIHRKHAIEVLIHGACHPGGADILADMWAKDRGVPVEAYPVDHDVDGPWPYAGPRRNERMLLKTHPTHCVAFGEGKGTDGMVRLFNAVAWREAPAWRIA